ncbi:NAD(P)-binding domain-containing protein [Cellulomonas sp.]|uniref:NAD(P)-binding domain-containing protein n=1 Tax=Cellulomonas sp. TaxID=40001 RepID=UPI00338E261A
MPLDAVDVATRALPVQRAARSATPPARAHATSDDERPAPDEVPTQRVTRRATRRTLRAADRAAGAARDATLPEPAAPEPAAPDTAAPDTAGPAPDRGPRTGQPVPGSGRRARRARAVEPASSGAAPDDAPAPGDADHAEDGPAAPAVSRSRRRRAATAAGPERAAGAPDGVLVDVVVIGAGQAGLSAAYQLRKAGLVPVGDRGWEDAAATFVVLDDAPAPGGAWQHRAPGLRVMDAHGVHDLPGMPLLVPDPAESAARAVPYYFAQYEEAFGLHVQRPVTVTRVEDAGERLTVTSHLVDAPEATVRWHARGLVNASGTWRKPFWPAYPGREVFTGRQLHSRDVRDPAELADGHVVVVGGGTSAVQLLLALARVTTTTWVTRRPPLWRDAQFTPEVGRAAVALVDERTRAGLPPGSIVSVTGLPLTDEYRAGIAAGVLRARPPFSRLTPDGVAWDGPPPSHDAVDPAAPDDEARALGAWVDGPDEVAARTVVWATGYRPALDHLTPLRLRASGGGVVMDGTRVVADPRVHLVGYGPSASTIGANRAGRDAVRALLEHLTLPG